MFLLNEQTFSQLPDDLQTLVLEAGQASAEVNRAAEAEATSKARAALEKEGVQIDDVDTSAFRAGVAPVFEKAAQDLGVELLDRIESAQSDC